VSALLVLACAAEVGRGADSSPVVLPGESRTTASRLDEVRKKIADKQWPEAIADLQAILDSPAGDDLVAATPQHSLVARRLCHLQIAAFPPDALKLYRNRIDPQARKWLEEGTEQRDARRLLKIVDEAFCSRPAEAALDLLGDLAFERGRFEEAESWWRMLAPLDEAKAPGGFVLVYPDPQGDVARIRAKQLLARIFRGARVSLPADLKAYRARHGTAEGKLAGRKGNYADLLQTIFAEKEAESLGGFAPATFGGDSSRGQVVPAESRILDRLSGLCKDGPTYRFSLKDGQQLEGILPAKDRPRPDAERARSLAFFPVMAGQRLLIADASTVTAFDLRTGKTDQWYDLAKQHPEAVPPRALPAPPDKRYTLTVADGYVFARLGAQERDAKKCTSFLVCLSLEADAGGEHHCWTLPSRNAKDKDDTVFEGTPVVADGRLYIAATRFSGDRAVTAVHCYPVEKTKPAPRWELDVCEVRGAGPKGNRPHNQLLTMAGPYLVYCSHTGAVVALEAATGRRVWGVRYPNRGNRTADGERSPRDLAPCLYAGGRIYVAPVDCDRLLCLDPGTGRTLWEREGIEVVHLLGVGEGRLIFTTPTGLRAVGAADGSNEKGWLLPHDGGKLPSFGRGLLLGDLVLWPTAAAGRVDGKVYAIRQRDGEGADNDTLLYQVPVGNLLYAEGCLVVADREVLSVFVPLALRLREKEERARQETDCSTVLDLAKAEADAGLLGRALESCVRAERLAGTAGGRDRARAEKHRVLLETARRAAGEKKWDEAAAVLDKAMASEFPVRARLTAKAQAGELWQTAGRPERAVSAWQAILSSDEWRALSVQDRSGIPQTAAAVAAEQIARLLAADSAAYEATEKQARTLYDAAPSEQRVRTAERLAREFPHAAITRTALRELASSYEEAKRPGAAADTYRLLLAAEGSSAEKAAALIGLARAYEQQNCWDDARALWKRLEQEHGSEKLPLLAADRSVRAWVTEHLRGPAFLAGPPRVSLPWSREWRQALVPGEMTLRVEDEPSGPGGDIVLTGMSSSHSGGQLISRDGETGKVRWKSVLPFVPEWAGSHADLVVTAGAGGVACLRHEDGMVRWVFATPAYDRYPTDAVPTLRPLPDRPAEQLAAFRLEADRIFFLQGQRRLFALDVESGRVLWAQWAPAAVLHLPRPLGCFFADYQVQGNTLLIRTGMGHARLLDAGTGKLLRDSLMEPESGPQTILVVAGRGACVATDSRHVRLFDPTTGKERWVYESAGVTTPSGASPRLLGGDETLLVVEETNVGFHLQRLDWDTGKPLWARSWRLGGDRPDLRDWALDGNAVYFRRGDFICAAALEDGRPLWEKPLPGSAGNWRLLRHGDGLIAWPMSPVVPRFQFRWLCGALQWNEGPLPERGSLRFPVACLDPRTGTIVQRLNFSAGAPGRPRLGMADGFDLMPRLEPRSMEDFDSWQPVRATRRGAVVTSGGEIWGLSGTKK
jgi:outer membrane protein assembly factor BamB